MGERPWRRRGHPWGVVCSGAGAEPREGPREPGNRLWSLFPTAAPGRAESVSAFGPQPCSAVVLLPPSPRILFLVIYECTTLLRVFISLESHDSPEALTGQRLYHPLTGKKLRRGAGWKGSCPSVLAELSLDLLWCAFAKYKKASW